MPGSGAGIRAAADSVAAPKPPAMRRLTEAQYRAVIAYVFGPDIKISGRFEPERRADGLLAIGSSQVSISDAGFEQYYAMAQEIATQVTDADHRATLFSCKPANEKASDDKCAETFL